jgi:hypothetical protein
MRAVFVVTGLAGSIGGDLPDILLSFRLAAL